MSVTAFLRYSFSIHGQPSIPPSRSPPSKYSYLAFNMDSEITLNSGIHSASHSHIEHIYLGYDHIRHGNHWAQIAQLRFSDGISRVFILN